MLFHRSRAEQKYVQKKKKKKKRQSNSTLVCVLISITHSGILFLIDLDEKKLSD